MKDKAVTEKKQSGDLCKIWMICIVKKSEVSTERGLHRII